MTGAEVLTVMRDHAGVSGVSGGKLCHCGAAFLTPLEHTVHVAEAIADAIRDDARARRRRRDAAVVPSRPGRKLVPACELDLDDLGKRVVAPIPGLGDASGLLLRVDQEPADVTAGKFAEIELLPPGDAPPKVYLIRRDVWVEVYAA